MRTIFVAILCLGFASLATGLDLGNQAPVKTPAVYPQDVPGPQRQGGDTIATAMVIPAIPFDDIGTTVGYHDDYDETCPVDGNVAPDVVYRYTAVGTMAVNIDLCGSNYDTKVYVYDIGLNLIACNDDYYWNAPCGVYVSLLENVTLNDGMTYYVIIDGYGISSGTYVLAIDPFVPCVLDCPVNGVAEGEPPLVDNYVDSYNGGGSVPGYPFQALTADPAGNLTLCGVAGWYVSGGSQYLRDTDWYILQAGGTGAIGITADAEFASYVFELGPQDCAAVGVVQQMTAGDCAEASMTISGYAPGAPVWFWVGPTVFVAPDGGDSEYDYVVWFTGLASGVAAEVTTWSTVKALYD
jgi:hypothetical protein